MEWPDGPQLQGIAAIIGALGLSGFFTIRGRRKQKAGVPASDAEIDKNLVDDKRDLEAECDDLREQLATAQGEHLRRDAIAEAHRSALVRIYEAKISDIIRQRDAAYESSTRNRRRFIERYGEENLGIFVQLPDPGETWSYAELRELKRIRDDLTS